jgi:hypothetical protein
MIELTDMKGKELVDIKESNDNELELIFKNDKYIIKIVDGKFTVMRKD